MAFRYGIDTWWRDSTMDCGRGDGLICSDCRVAAAAHLNAGADHAA
jgi:hypothetical protein